MLSDLVEPSRSRDLAGMLLLAVVTGWLIIGLPYLLRALQGGWPLGRAKGRDARDEAASLDRTREEFAAFRLEVARTYVPLSLIRDVDQRLTQHLMRIEQKLDEATRAAILAAARVAVLEEERK